MKHRHHIIPKHMGGSNESSNIKLLTTKEHAEAHQLLWEEHNHIEDYIAWKCLSGRKLTEEDRIELSKSGHKKFLTDPVKYKNFCDKIRKARQNQIITEEHKKNISKGLHSFYDNGGKRPPLSDESRSLLRTSYYENNKNEKLSDGRKNSALWRYKVSCEETLTKRRLSTKKRKPISVDGRIYDSIRHAAKETKYNYSTLRRLVILDSYDNIFFC